MQVKRERDNDVSVRKVGGQLETCFAWRGVDRSDKRSQGGKRTLFRHTSLKIPTSFTSMI